jgi:hypothetical protein
VKRGQEPIDCRNILSTLWCRCCCREQKAELAEKLKAKAQELAEQFKADWQPVAENLDRAMKAFDDLEGASFISSAARPHITVRARKHQLPLLQADPASWAGCCFSFRRRS